ncbi:MAG: AAA family ATPase [Lachnospiraceae bacterium]|nr:AAA family ATPase [Lachnospiraceae bacterium]
MRLTTDNYKPLYEADPVKWSEMSLEGKFDYLTDEIHKGNSDARFHLSLLVNKSNITNIKAEKVIEWCHRIPDNTLPLASLLLGFCYELGYGVEKDYVKALASYENANQKGSIDSLFYLGELYRLGLGTPINYQKAAAFLKETVKYDTGNPNALISLALLYMDGNGVPHDPEKAMELLKGAQLLNSSLASYYLGLLMEKNDDNSAAANYYREALKWNNLGEEGFDAAYHLGLIYDCGSGVVHDDYKAIDYYKRAAEGGHVEAQLKYAEFLKDGRGCDKDIKLSEKWYLKAALSGNARAQYHIGELLENGNDEENIKSDINAAFEWYTRSAVKGCEEATEKVEGFYSHGYNVHQDIGAALKMLRAASAKGNAGAAEELNRLIQEGVMDENSNIKQTTESSRSSMEDLDELIGMETIKKDVRELINLVKMQKLRKEKGMKSMPVSLHLVFTGNPGTGKTTVARILADIYREIGILSSGQLVEVDRAGLVAGYVGQTAIKTQEKIDEANGGILFIDEAYTLAKKGGQDYGQEAIDTLINLMEKRRDNFIVIVAGYPDLMRDFINSNPGLKSRFNKYIHFPDYSSEELVQIFTQLCSKYEYQLQDDAKEIVQKRIEDHVANKNESFSNARDIRNIFETIVSNQASRVMTSPDISDEDIMTITAADCGQ